MKLVTYRHHDAIDFGILEPTCVRPLGETLRTSGEYVPSLLELIQAFDCLNIDHLIDRSPELPLDQIVLEAPFPYALRNVLCLGKNYLDHVNEVKNLANDNHQPPSVPIYFTKLIDQFTGPHDPLYISQCPSDKVDYEVELAVIIGKEGKNISSQNAYDHIFGYSVANDFSARDLQSAHNQWFKGKSLDGFCAFGPVIVTKDEFDTPPALAITSHVNDELRQNGRTDDLIFDIAHIIADLSSGLTLRAGDIILTGTPAGVGAGFNPPKFLKIGDVVRSEIEGIGVLETTIM